VVILTTFDLDEYVYEGLPRGETLLAPSVTRRLIATDTRPSAAIHTLPPGADELTARERESGC
jgi:hypothetical protein